MAYYQHTPPTALRTLVSVERMGTYERLAEHHVGDALTLYVLDVDLASAFMADLALLEIVLRNALNNQLSEHFGTEWFRREGLFDLRSRAAITRAWEAGKCRNDTPPGKLVAQLTLAFWVGLLDAGGRAGKAPHDEKRSYDELLWRPCLRHAFPNGAGRRSTQHEISKRVHALRNRVAHHEPLLGGIPIPGTRVRRSLPDAHQDVLALVSDIDHSVRDWIATHSRVPELLRSISPRAHGESVPQQ